MLINQLHKSAEFQVHWRFFLSTGLMPLNGPKSWNRNYFLLDIIQIEKICNGNSIARTYFKTIRSDSLRTISTALARKKQRFIRVAWIWILTISPPQWHSPSEQWRERESDEWNVRPFQLIRHNVAINSILLECLSMWRRLAVLCYNNSNSIVFGLVQA